MTVSLKTFAAQYPVVNIQENQSVVSLNDVDVKKASLKKVGRLVLIGELFLNSIKLLRNKGIKIDYVDSRSFTYKTSSDGFTLKDDDHSVSIKKSDIESTIILMRSGYSKVEISSALNDLAQFGVLVVNEPAPVETSSDKYLTAEMLNKYGIKQPVYALVTSSDIHKEDHSKLDAKLKSIYKHMDDDTKFVCKILNGHGGKGVFVCRKSNITSILQCIFAIDKKCDILVQEFISVDEGDIRAHVITLNGKQELIHAIRRNKGRDFRTNLSLGNSMEEIELTKEQKQLAFDAAKASGLVWAGVDILPVKGGKDYVVEINGAPGPSSPINDPNIEQTNADFFYKFIETLNTLC